MADNGDEVQYRYQTIKVIRGREANKVAEMERQGWQVDKQTTGRLRTEITFRQVVTPSRFKPWMAIAALFAFGVLCLGGVAIAEVVGGGDDDKSAAKDESSQSATPTTDTSETPSGTPAPSGSETPSETASETPSESASAVEPSPSATETLTATPTQDPTEPLPTAAPVDEVLTVKNNADLKKLLASNDNYVLNNAFAKQYAGRMIEFDGSVANVAGSLYLVYAGDNSDTESAPGPAFQFHRAVLVDGVRARTGDNLRFVATVGTFNANQGLFFLDPVSASRR